MFQNSSYSKALIDYAGQRGACAEIRCRLVVAISKSLVIG